MVLDLRGFLGDCRRFEGKDGYGFGEVGSKSLGKRRFAARLVTVVFLN